MGEYELWVGGQTNTQTDRQTDRHINTMTRPGLGAGPSENPAYGQHSALSYVCDSGVPNLYHDSMGVIYTMSPCLYHESLSVP